MVSLRTFIAQHTTAPLPTTVRTAIQNPYDGVRETQGVIGVLGADISTNLEAEIEEENLQVN